MNAFTYLAIHDAVCAAAAVFLVIHDRPWWAAVFIFAFLMTTVKQKS